MRPLEAWKFRITSMSSRSCLLNRFILTPFLRQYKGNIFFYIMQIILSKNCIFFKKITSGIAGSRKCCTFAAKTKTLKERDIIMLGLTSPRVRVPVRGESAKEIRGQLFRMASKSSETSDASSHSFKKCPTRYSLTGK